MKPQRPQRNTLRFLKDYLLVPVIDVLYPPLCHHCDQLLPPHRHIICQSCWEQIPSFQGDIDQTLRERSFDKIYILFKYDEIVQKLIHLLKYNRYISITHYFVETAIKMYPELQNRSYDAIIPVPLHKIRLRERGYNQSEVIATTLSEKLHTPVKNELLLRTRHTASQTTFSKKERDKNVKDAFYCPNTITDKKILLVDDVITTGSTAEACLRCLKNAGVDQVNIFTIAHPPPGRLK